MYLCEQFWQILDSGGSGAQLTSINVGVLVLRPKRGDGQGSCPKQGESVLVAHTQAYTQVD